MTKLNDSVGGKYWCRWCINATDLTREFKA
jgi:hypothetical protein